MNKKYLSRPCAPVLLSCVLLLAFAGSTLAAGATSFLLPKPRQLTEYDARFLLNRGIRLTDPTGSALLAQLFQVDASASATVSVNIVDAATLGTFDYPLAGFDNEGYRLLVEADAVTITAATKTGVIRAAQTLMQLAQATDGTAIPAVSITDYPAFKLRGYMHDVGRSFISFDELKHEIDLLSRFKVNVFHWHLTDNQAFRFESKVFPQLNKASAMTRFAGQYYTQAQCTELEAYAAERGITIIPEIDMPGHSQTFTATMGYTMSSSEGRAALKQLLSELATAFPRAPYIHMGADEAGTTAEFVNEMSKYIKETLGRCCIVWNPISGVSITASNLPYIDMTEMWSTAGKKISGLPNIDCRYNYVNHFDVFADLVGIYKSNIYYAQQGSSELAGAITALWNDRKMPTETDIVRQNNLYANVLATAERGWIGGGNQYIETGGTTLPGSGREYEEFADWERRFLHYKATWLAEEPIPYVRQTDVHWRITEPFPNGGTASAVFPPETATDDILPEQFTYGGKTYMTSLATGAGIYLRHVWGTTVPAFFASPQLNTTAYAWTYVYSPTAQTAGALIEFQNYSRSENDKAPDAGQWDRKGSRIWINDEELLPPTWDNSGKSISSEVNLGNENFAAREPMTVHLRAGWNKVLLKLPYVAASNVRLNKWMFTFVLTDTDGRNALEGITYSPIQSLDPFVDDGEHLSLSSTSLDELKGHDMRIDQVAADQLTTAQWYLMRNTGRKGYLYEKNTDHKLYTQATPPSGSPSDNAAFLVRLVDADGGRYYLQTGYGNYFATLIDGMGGSGGGNNNGTTAVPKADYAIGNIAGSYFYLVDANGVVMDANTVGATVAGWGTTIPTNTSGNASWQFFPVTLSGDTPDALPAVTDNHSTRTFDLSGREVTTVTSHSLYIQDGRKIFIP